MQQEHTFSSEQGFSLIEVAIALAVMGIIAGLALPPMLNLLAVHKNRVTETHQQVVMTALAAHTLRTGKLPCPAKPETPGLAKESCQNPQECQGNVPYLTLGIPEKYAKDGFQQPLLYAVEPRLTYRHTVNRRAPDNACEKVNHSQSLVVKDSQGQNVLPKADADDFMAVVLIGTGEARLGMKPGIYETINNQMDLNFVDHPYSQNPKNLHRHILKWASRDFLLAHYGQFSCPAYRARQDNLQDEIHEPRPF